MHYNTLQCSHIQPCHRSVVVANPDRNPLTPDQVHYGQADAVHAARQLTLDQAFRDNPERFVNKPPTPPNKPTATWINPPAPKSRA